MSGTQSLSAGIASMSLIMVMVGQHRSASRRSPRVTPGYTASVALLLLPVVTHTVTFHEAAVGQADIFFLRGRIAFLSAEGRRDRAPFGSMMVLFGADEPMVERQLGAFDCLHVPRAVAHGPTAGVLTPNRSVAATAGSIPYDDNAAELTA